MLGLGTDITSSSYVSMDLKDATTDLELWLKNNTGVTVSKWNDSSGNNNHATQSTEANQAAVSGGGLDFEEGESDHYDLTSDITIAQNGGFCLAFVVHMETVSNNTLFSKSGNEQVKIVNGTEFFFKADDDTTTSTVFVFESGTFDTSKALFLLNRSAGATNRFTFFKNGIQLTPDGDSSSNEAAGENPFGFDINVLGSLQGSGSFFDGKILEVAFWSKGLSLQEITDVNDYLKSVHGL
tara:strand:- start:11 stop:727 length:717 start_codon:yes stop_codon:yes gene_type:complete